MVEVSTAKTWAEEKYWSLVIIRRFSIVIRLTIESPIDAHGSTIWKGECLSVEFLMAEELPAIVNAAVEE